MPKSVNRISVKILLLVYGSFLILSVYFIINSYNTHLKNEEARELLKLSSILKSLSAQMEGEELEMIFEEFPEPGDIMSSHANKYYQRQYEILNKASVLNNLRTPIYTLTHDSIRDIFFIGLRSTDPPYYRQVFIPHSEDLFKIYNLGGTSCRYIDESGKWLSAYEPLKNKAGKTVGVLAIDVPFNEFIITATYIIFKDILFAVIMFMILGILLGSQIKKILKKEENSKNDLVQFSNLLEVKNKEITDSIHYASKIQCSFIPLLSEVKASFPESFIYYKPKDIISGDFYWIKKLNENEHLIAVVDCTGHGVPGAMMSVIGNNLFNHIVSGEKITEPAKIIQQLHERINKLLNQNGNGTQDGMALSICLINKEKHEIIFAGSYNDSYLMQKNGTLVVLEADKIPVGGELVNNNSAYRNTLICYNPGDRLYLFTDGFADQFGGNKNKKFMKKQLRNLISETTSFDIKTQFNLIKAAFENWMGTNFQVDDITMIGVKL